MLNRIRNRLKRLLQPKWPVQVELPTARYGSDYGGWTVYAEGLTPESVIYSVGVGEDASWDRAMIEQHDVTIHAFDPTPRAVAWVEAAGLPEGFRMHPYGLADFDGTTTFYPPENPEHVSHTILARPATAARAIQAEMRRLPTLMAMLGHSYIDVLKMDIEGAEYSVIPDILNVPIGQILVEFHHRFDSISVRQTRRALRMLNQQGYRTYAVHAGTDFCLIKR